MSQELTDSSAPVTDVPEHQRSNIPEGLVEGKRVKKTVERLDLQARKQTEKLKIGDGTGDKLGDIPRINYQISRIKTAELKPLHAILFDRPGKISTVKKNLRLFNGFSFPAGGDQFTKKREKILKSFTNSKLKLMCTVLDLEKKGTHSDLVDRIMSFLSVPTNSGKLPPAKKKKKKKKKKLSGDSSQARTKKKLKPKPRSSSSSPKKSKSGSKSEAIVMDSSSDEEEEEEEEDEKAEPKEETSDTEKQSEKEELMDTSDESEEEEEEEEEEDDDEESHKSKTGRAKPAVKKAPPTKRQRAPARRAAPPRKRVRKVLDESDSDTDEKTNKKSAATKPTAKTKKADSSSNSRNTTNTADDHSDDDEPLINIIKKAPRDDQLKETVQSLLKEANLEEMTMKQICQKVFDTYPEHDLSGKKDYIKQTVKSLIT